MHPLVTASFTQGDPTIAAAETGEEMLAGQQNVPISELHGDVNTAGIVEREVVNARGPVVIDPQDPPPLPEPAPNRVATFVRAFTRAPMWGIETRGGTDSPGSHGEVVPGASMPPGLQMTQVPGRGNTWRLPPSPWDSPLWVAQHGSEAGHAP